jgi:23S rRNA (uridine2552-2'-O)-methyltransferase
MARSKSSNKWLTEHFDDQYVKQAQQLGLRSRSAFKLREMQQKYGLIKKGMNVVDLGAAPGGWCQVALPLVGSSGRVIGLDLLSMEPLDGVQFIQGDFRENEPLEYLQNALNGQAIDLVMSDMAPNMSGIAATDQAAAMYLAELALEFSVQNLKPGGAFLVKLFQGESYDSFLQQARETFEQVKILKPGASRARSREVYMVARMVLVR